MRRLTAVKYKSSEYYELIAAKEDIKKLEENLQETRKDLINLVPFELSIILLSYRSCSDRRVADDWWGSALDKIISHAKILYPPERYSLGERAFCPLCGSGSSTPYEKGFALPEGLRRHLKGFGRARQCIVAKTAFRLARDYWNKKFSKADELERERDIAETDARRKTDTLYLLSPESESTLLDKKNCYLPSRDETQLLWAEARLLDLKFSIRNNDNVKSYTKEYGGYIVYADPLTLGRIVFRLYNKAQRKATRRSASSLSMGIHTIQDKWKNNLSAKLDIFVSGIISSIEHKVKGDAKSVY